jgi:hypothetical protein
MLKFPEPEPRNPPRAAACSARRSRAGRSRARDIRGRMLLGRGSGLPRDPRGAADRRRLYRRTRTQPHLLSGLRPLHRPCRSRRSMVRSGPGQLRAAAGCLLAHAPSDHPQPPGMVLAPASRDAEQQSLTTPIAIRSPPRQRSTAPRSTTSATSLSRRGRWCSVLTQVADHPDDFLGDEPADGVSGFAGQHHALAVWSSACSAGTGGASRRKSRVSGSPDRIRRTTAAGDGAAGGAGAVRRVTAARPARRRGCARRQCSHR